MACLGWQLVPENNLRIQYKFSLHTLLREYRLNVDKNKIHTITLMHQTSYQNNASWEQNILLKQYLPKELYLSSFHILNKHLTIKLELADLIF